MFTQEQIAGEFNLNTSTPFELKVEDMKAFLDKNIPAVNRPNSVLYECLPSFIQAERENGVNGVYLLCHACLETGWGSSAIAHRKKNLFGYGAYDASPMNSAHTFATYGDSVLAVSRAIKKNYLMSDGKYYSKKYGPTLRGMNVNYARDPKWHNSIAGIMLKFANFVTERSK
jgi:beta-N-acetylglucosaminidase